MKATCPFRSDGLCHPGCMLLLAWSEEVQGAVDKGQMHCSIAVLASHMASDRHFGGNYLMRTVIVGYGDEEELDEERFE